MQAHVSFSRGHAHGLGPRSSCSKKAVAAQRHQQTAPRGGRRVFVVVRAAGDYYDLLGVSRDADTKTIKQAYRQKARKFHPVSAGCAGGWVGGAPSPHLTLFRPPLQDVNKEAGAEDTFKKIGEAYEVSCARPGHEAWGHPSGVRANGGRGHACT
jgi:hypothetical protein